LSQGTQLTFPNSKTVLIIHSGSREWWAIFSIVSSVLLLLLYMTITEQNSQVNSIEIHPSLLLTIIFPYLWALTEPFNHYKWIYILSVYSALWVPSSISAIIYGKALPVYTWLFLPSVPVSQFIRFWVSNGKDLLHIIKKILKGVGYRRIMLFFLYVTIVFSGVYIIYYFRNTLFVQVLLVVFLLFGIFSGIFEVVPFIRVIFTSVYLEWKLQKFYKSVKGHPLLIGDFLKHMAQLGYTIATSRKFVQYVRSQGLLIADQQSERVILQLAMLLEAAQSDKSTLNNDHDLEPIVKEWWNNYQQCLEQRSIQGSLLRSINLPPSPKMLDEMYQLLEHIRAKQRDKEIV
jgi:hypothetical protein